MVISKATCAFAAGLLETANRGPICNAFTEGFESVGLTDAKTLLDKLS